MSNEPADGVDNVNVGEAWGSLNFTPLLSLVTLIHDVPGLGDLVSSASLCAGNLR